MSYSWYSLKTCYAFSDPPLEEDDLPPGEWVCHRCRVTPSEVSAHLHFTSRLPMTALWHVFVSFFFSVLPFFLLCVWFLPVLRLRKQFFFLQADFKVLVVLPAQQSLDCWSLDCALKPVTVCKHDLFFLLLFLASFLTFPPVSIPLPPLIF